MLRESPSLLLLLPAYAMNLLEFKSARARCVDAGLPASCGWDEWALTIAAMPDVEYPTPLGRCK